VISGPNAGGKTVALKTLGLLVLMHEWGLAIPSPMKAPKSAIFKARLYRYRRFPILADNLSTFSGHMSNLAGHLF
jgi:DNA mismatch repair protein MutS2